MDTYGTQLSGFFLLGVEAIAGCTEGCTWMALSMISLIPCAVVNSGATTLASMSNDGGSDSLIVSRGRAPGGTGELGLAAGPLNAAAPPPDAFDLRGAGWSALTKEKWAGGGSRLP